MPSPTQFLGNTVGEAAAFAAGLVVAPVLRPEVEIFTNQAWATVPTRPLDPILVAEAVARGHIPHDLGSSEARLSGISAKRFDELVATFKTGPGLAAALALWRRKAIKQGQYEDALTLEGVQDAWQTELEKLYWERISAQDLAYMVVRGVVPDAGTLPSSLPTRADDLKLPPQLKLDTLAEAEAHGFDPKRFAALVARSGLAMAPVMAAQAVFRKILTENDYELTIARGDLFPAYAAAVKEVSRQIPSASDYVTAHLKGWIDEKAMEDGAARHGMTKDDVGLLYLRAGRPAAPGQMATAAARGIAGPDGKPMDRPQFLKGIAESDIRPEWGPMLWDSRFLYPPLFQLTRLVQGGAITPAVAADWATKDRYPPEVVTALTTYWQTLGGGEATDPRVKLATSQAIAALKKAFLREQMDEQGVTNGLEQVGVSATAADQILGLWILERLWTEKPLTPAVIKKAYRNGELALDEATARLVQQQWSAADANIYLTT